MEDNEIPLYDSLFYSAVRRYTNHNLKIVPLQDNRI